MRCKHQNCEMMEYEESQVSHTFYNGEYTGSLRLPMSYKTKVLFECFDCGKTFSFSYYRLPKWAKILKDEMIDNDR
jgi:hypothetical protein